MTADVPAERVFDLADLARQPRPVDEVGGKAAGLARLIAAGLPVPRGLVAGTAVRDPAEVAARAAGLGPPLVVRSSAASEDLPGLAAAGVFASRRDVDAAGLADALAAVWASVDGDTARGYLEARGLATPAMAAIVQEQATGRWRCTVYTRPPGRADADELMIEAADRNSAGTAVLGRDGVIRAADAGFPLPAACAAALARAAVAAEVAIGAGAGADVELVAGDDTLWIVQARPIVHPSPIAEPPAELFAFSAEQPDLVWEWDAAHNPDPLSPAHIGLVERADTSGAGGVRLRAIGGYLYTAALPRPEAPALDAETLRARFAGELRPAMESALAIVDADPEPSLAAALTAFDRVHALYAGELTPLLARARRALPDLLAVALGAAAAERCAAEILAAPPPGSLQSLLAATARGELAFDRLLAIVGPLAPVWDVAAPSWGERPDQLRAAVARAARRPPAPAADPLPALRAQVSAPELEPAVALALVARELGDHDDVLFGRAQHGVRRALLALGRRWRLPNPDDIFFLPLPDDDRPPAPARDLASQAAAARASHRAQRALAMPLRVSAGRPLPEPRASSGGVWRGRGAGGRATGSAWLLRGGRLDAAPDDAVVIAASLTPAMVVSLRAAAALVSEFGGLLGHGAALARELGIPCVVGCRGITGELTDGDRVWVDGAAGLVVRVQVR